MAERLAGGNAALALLCNTLATGAALVVLITMFAPISGAHFNPAVSLVFRLRGALNTSELAAYVAAQVVGAVLGVLAAHLMFDETLLQISQKVRTGPGQWFSEGVATFGLVLDHPPDAQSPPRGRSRLGRSLHHVRLLVHGLDVVCQPGRDLRAVPDQHICRYPPRGCGRIRAWPVGWRRSWRNAIAKFFERWSYSGTEIIAFSPPMELSPRATCPPWLLAMSRAMARPRPELPSVVRALSMR